MCKRIKCIRRIQILSLSLLLSFTVSCISNDKTAQHGLVYIANDDIKLGISPRLGGRVLVFQQINGSNILKSLKKHHSVNESEINYALVKKDYVDYYGHMNWVSPQSNWWSQQDIYPEKKGAGWPPDPFIEFGKFAIIQQTPASLILQGQHSKISGVTLKKEFHIKGNRVVLKTTAVNTSKKTLKWALWSNTRLPGKANVLVPVEKNSTPFKLSMKIWYPWKEQLLSYRIDDSFFTFNLPDRLPKGYEVCRNKAYLRPKNSVIGAYINHNLFIKKTDTIHISNVPPGQAPVEIYQAITDDPASSVAEMEFQGKYQAIPKGESISFEEEWQLFPAKSLNEAKTIFKSKVQPTSCLQPGT